MKHLIIILLLGLTGCNNQFQVSNLPASTPFVANPLTPTPAPTNLYYSFYINYNSLCLEMDGTGRLVQNVCATTGSSQQFQIIEDTASFKMMQPNSVDQCLTYVSGQAEVSTSTCLDGSMEQSWVRIASASGDYQIKNSASGQCLNIPNGYSTPNLQLILYSCSSSGNEQPNEIFQIIESQH
jgi:hypothetical protein